MKAIKHPAIDRRDRVAQINDPRYYSAKVRKMIKALVIRKIIR